MFAVTQSTPELSAKKENLRPTRLFSEGSQTRLGRGPLIRGERASESWEAGYCFNDFMCVTSALA